MRIRVGATTILEVATTSAVQRGFTRTVDLIAHARMAQVSLAATEPTADGFSTAVITTADEDLDATWW